jgi:DNA-binding CsgD family transcriptional regulator
LQGLPDGVWLCGSCRLSRKERTLTRLNEKTLVDLIDQVYEVAFEPNLWPRCLETVRTTFDAGQAKFAYYDLASRDGSIEVAAGADPHYTELFRLRYARLNPWARNAQDKIRTGQVLHGEMLLPYEAVVRTEFYNDFLRPQDLHYWASSVLFQSEKVFGVLLVSRSRRAGRFTDEELAFQRELTPHLQRGAALYRKFREIELTRSCLLESVESLETGVILLDSQGRMTAYNRAAAEVLEGRDGLILGRDGGLTALDRSSCAMLEKLIGQALQMSCGNGRKLSGTLAVQRVSRRRPYSVSVAPISSPHGERVLDLPYACVSVVDPEKQLDSAKKKLSTIFALTGAEATLAVHLSRGKSLAAAATEMGVSMNTIRTHLKRIFSKTDTNRQGELVALLNTFRADPVHPSDGYSGIQFPN